MKKNMLLIVTLVALSLSGTVAIAGPDMGSCTPGCRCILGHSTKNGKTYVAAHCLGGVKHVTGHYANGHWVAGGYVK